MSDSIKSPIKLTTHNSQVASVSCSLSMRVQKKVLSKLSKRGVVRLFANDRICVLMDMLYALLKHHYDQQIAEKLVKNIIKLTFKLGAMERENTLNAPQHQLLVEIEWELRQLALTIQSFQALPYSYNQQFLLKLLNKLHNKTHSLVEQTLSDKSGRRIEYIFDYLSNNEFLKKLAFSFPGHETKEGPDDFSLFVRKFTDTLGELMLGESARSNNGTSNEETKGAD